MLASTGLSQFATLTNDDLYYYSNNSILFYDNCQGKSNYSGEGGTCPKLAELRTAMWNNASQTDKENFMYTVSRENHSLAGVEGYMNQAIARSDGNLNNWLNGLCPRFRGGSSCTGSHTISPKEQKWIDAALAGSNLTNGATGNSSWSRAAGDATTGGPLTCFWISSDNENGGECKSDVDYSQPPFSENKDGTKCSDMIKAAGGDINSGWECWAWDNTKKWSSSLQSQCAGANSLGSVIPSTEKATEETTSKTKQKSSDKDDADSSSDKATENQGETDGEKSKGPSPHSTTSAHSATAINSSITWDKDGWIISGIEGYKKESVPSLGTKYKSGLPNKILLHYTQGSTPGLAAYGSSRANKVAAHFTIDLRNKTVSQHHPLSRPSGAVKDAADVLDIVQIEIVGFGFDKDNPDSPDSNSKCIIDGVDETSSDYCFAKFGHDEWGYLAELLTGISKWAKENGGEIPLTSTATWTGKVGSVRMTEKEFNDTRGIVAHMHAPYNDHNDTGNIWPMVSEALGTTTCSLNNASSAVKGAKNSEKQANEIGAMTFGDHNKAEMKTLLENYGDLAYRTGQAYGVPWIAILVQGRYEDSKAKCGNNNFWGIACYPGTKEGNGKNIANVGEGFMTYGKTVHNGNYEAALKETDPYQYLVKLGPMWVQGKADGPGYGSINDMKNSIDALTEYINSAEGQAVVASFGGATCYDVDICNGVANGDVSALQNLVKEWAHPEYGPHGSSALSAYHEAMRNARYRGGCSGQDCGAFVSNLMVKSGWDPDYDTCSTGCQIDYLEGSSKWEDITSQIKSNDDAQPGDVIICNHNKKGYTCGSRHHVLVFVGDIPGFGGKMASASQCNRWPEADKAKDINSYVSQGFHVFRKTG